MSSFAPRGLFPFNAEAKSVHQNGSAFAIGMYVSLHSSVYLPHEVMVGNSGEEFGAKEIKKRKSKVRCLRADSNHRLSLNPLTRHWGYWVGVSSVPHEDLLVPLGGSVAAHLRSIQGIKQKGEKLRYMSSCGIEPPAQVVLHIIEATRCRSQKPAPRRLGLVCEGVDG